MVWKDRPKRVIVPYVKGVLSYGFNSEVLQDSRNPVGIRRDYTVRLNTFDDR